MTYRRIILSALVSFIIPAHAETYHLDSLQGNDANSGLTPELAWKSLEKANVKVLKPGDQLLLKAACRWSGQLAPQGAGSSTAKVLIGRYGEGALPRIDGEGKHVDAVLLKNFPFVEMADLEVTNEGPERGAWRTGVNVLADNVGKIEQTSLKRLYVHDVNGNLDKSDEGCGIFFEVKGENMTHFDGFLIEKCRLERTDRNGICQRGRGIARSKNVIIRENTLEDIGGDGIKLWGTDGGLIEKNVVRKARARAQDAAAGIWPFASDDTLIQFNEVSETVGVIDGQAFDSDYACRRTVIQYNYSFRNEGGFVLICSPGESFNEDTIIRYNISVHDGIKTARIFHFGGKPQRTYVYNNTVIVGSEQELPLIRFTEWNGGNTSDTTFTNNLFIVEKGGTARYDFGLSRNTIFHNNYLAGSHQLLPEVVSDEPVPTLVGPISPQVGLASLKAYSPKKSDNIPLGRVITGNGGRDILGNPVSADQPPLVGAIQIAQ